MKYGETLRQRSIPAWQTHNIDYEDIKHFIKENTTPGKGKAVPIPGSTDPTSGNFESALYSILYEQHERINWFARSKVGEIRRRLSHLEQQIQKFAQRSRTDISQGVSVKHLERYGKMETDIIRIGEEIKSLSRFIGVQQTAFRKLLKKYKKWTGSHELGDRFNGEVLQSTSSFSRTDLSPFVKQYDELLSEVRGLYDTQVGNVKTSRPKLTSTKSNLAQVHTSSFSDVRNLVDHGKLVEFDHLVASLRIGVSGRNAAYWVHPENVVELQVLLSQYTRSLCASRRQSSVSLDVPSPTGQSTPYRPSAPSEASDTQPNAFDVISDDSERYLKEKSSQTLENNEGRRGSTLQSAAIHVRGTVNDDSALIARPPHHRLGDLDKLVIRRKYVPPFLERDPSFVPQKAAVPSVSFQDSTQSSAGAIHDARHWLDQHADIRPIATIFSQRSRFYDFHNNASGVLLASLDNNISIHYGVCLDSGIRGSSQFPYAVLRVRQEGPQKSDLIQVLDNSHLLERVRGFSLEYHAIWDVCRPHDIAPPFWLPLLEQDLRKVPQAPARRDTKNTDFASQSTTPQVLTSTSTSDAGMAVDGEVVSKAKPDLDELTLTNESGFPKQRSRRKMKTRTYQALPDYWNEFDHPEDSDNENAYVLYINPNGEDSIFDGLWTKLTGLFRTSHSPEDRSLLSPHNDLESASPADSDDSDDETKPHNHISNSYGTLLYHAHRTTTSKPSTEQDSTFPKVPILCLAASISILATAFILAATGRRKLASEVDAGIIFAVASSVAFAVLGVVALVRHSRGWRWYVWLVALVVPVTVVVLCGGLLAWVLD